MCVYVCVCMCVCVLTKVISNGFFLRKFVIYVFIFISVCFVFVFGTELVGFTGVVLTYGRVLASRGDPVWLTGR